MEVRRIGSTGLTVSRIGLGLAALGRPGYINLGHGQDLDHDYDPDAMRERTWTTLSAAWERGVRYVDAARSYGRAEEFLSGWLASEEIAPQDITVGSKWGYTYTADWAIEAPVHEVKDHTLPTLQRQQIESLALLGPWLRLYQIHSATESSGVLDRRDVLDHLALLREEHQVAIGLTLSGPDARQTLERAMTIERAGRRLFDTVQATWNVLEPSLGPSLAAAHAGGMGVIVKEALANGRLTARNADPAFAAKMAVLTHHAQRLGCAIDQLALAAALDQPWADCVLSGASAPDQLVSNIGSLSILLDDDARVALAAVAEPVDHYWATRGTLRWN